jgi:hypothetical protein
MRERITLAVHLADEAAHLIAEAALRQSGLSATASIAILEPPSEPLEGIALNEALYAARAGTRPVRELAARRLAGAEGHAAASTLTQLLYDNDGCVAATALWALQQSSASRLPNALLSAARFGPRHRVGLDYPFTVTLLAAYRNFAPEGEARLFAFRESLEGVDPSDPLISDVDAVLRASPRGGSQG